MENRQYNLRSANRDTIQVPVQLQVGNTEFMSTVMNQNNDSHSDSISDSNDSHTDLDCSGLLNLSNDENYSKLTGGNSTKTDQTGNQMQASTSSVNSNPQLLINQQILDQLKLLVVDWTNWSTNRGKKRRIRQKLKRK